jgi:hypothetical protein
LQLTLNASLDVLKGANTKAMRDGGFTNAPQYGAAKDMQKVMKVKQISIK